MHKTKTGVDLNKASKYIHSSTTKSKFVCVVVFCFCFNTVCMMQNINQLKFQTNTKVLNEEKFFNWHCPRWDLQHAQSWQHSWPESFNSPNNENISSFYHWIEGRKGGVKICPRLHVLFFSECVLTYQLCLENKLTYSTSDNWNYVCLFLIGWHTVI